MAAEPFARLIPPRSPSYSPSIAPTRQAGPTPASCECCTTEYGKARRQGRHLSRAMEGIEYRRSKVLIDEIPAAYKDIDQVMENAKELRMAAQ